MNKQYTEKELKEILTMVSGITLKQLQVWMNLIVTSRESKSAFKTTGEQLLIMDMLKGLLAIFDPMEEISKDLHKDKNVQKFINVCSGFKNLSKDIL